MGASNEETPDRPRFKIPADAFICEVDEAVFYPPTLLKQWQERLKDSPGKLFWSYTPKSAEE